MTRKRSMAPHSGPKKRRSNKATLDSFFRDVGEEQQAEKPAKKRYSRLSPTERKEKASKAANTRWEKSEGDRMAEKRKRHVLRKARAYLRAAVSKYLREKRKLVKHIKHPDTRKAKLIELLGGANDEFQIDHYQDIEDTLIWCFSGEVGNEDPRPMINEWKNEAIGLYPPPELNGTASEPAAEDWERMAATIATMKERRKTTRFDASGFDFGDNTPTSDTEKP